MTNAMPEITIENNAWIVPHFYPKHHNLLCTVYIKYKPLFDIFHLCNKISGNISIQQILLI